MKHKTISNIPVMQCSACSNTFPLGNRCACGETHLTPTGTNTDVTFIEPFDYFNELSKINKTGWFSVSH